MFDVSSRAFKIIVLVVLCILIIVAVSLVMIKKNTSVKKKEMVAPKKEMMSPASPADIPAGDTSATPFVPPIKIERDPNAPPLISPEEVLKSMGIEDSKAPETIAPPAAPAPAPISDSAPAPATPPLPTDTKQ